MDSFHDHPEKRRILSAATFRFASPLQGLRESAQDQLITKVLFDLDNGTCADVNIIGEAYHAATHGGHLDPVGITQVLSRLEEKGNVEECKREGGKFRLTDESRSALEDAERHFANSLREMLCRLYDCTTSKAKRYEKPFLEVVALVAGSLGVESANQLVSGRSAGNNNSELIARAVEQVTAGYRNFDVREFRQGIVDFFRSSDPACHRVLWQLAESYFVARLIGIDPSGRSFSNEVFNNVTFVLDTNVILALVMSSDESHELVRAVLTAACALQIPLLVGDITLQEFNGTLARQYTALRKIVERGEDRWLGRLDSTVLREYHSLEETDPDRFIDKFSDVEERLKNDWAAHIVEMQRETTHDIEKFASLLRQRYSQVKPSDRTKSLTVALHDATVITYILEQRTNTNSELWLLTLDGSLPGAVPEDSEWPSLALAPRAAFQWLAPVVARSSADNRFATVFAEMVQASFLPKVQFLSTADFCMLLDVDESIGSMPDEDVESMLVRLRSSAMRLDTNKAEDREKLTAIVSASLADKHSRFQQRLRELEADRDRRVRQAEAEKEEAEQNWREQLAVSKQESDRKLREEREARVRAENDRLRTEGYIRFWTAIAVSLGLGATLAWILVPILTSLVNGWSGLWTWPPVALVSCGAIVLLLNQLALRRIVGEDRVLVMPKPYQALMGD